jgi:hypothetical protein
VCSWPLATAFSLQEGETRTLDLKVKKRPCRFRLESVSDLDVAQTFRSAIGQA